MGERVVSGIHIELFQQHLKREEKSKATIEKYLRDVRVFMKYAGLSMITKDTVITYKQYLEDKKYAVSSINSMLVSLNRLLLFLGWADCKVTLIKTQKETYLAEDKELTKMEYLRLLEAANGNTQLKNIIMTICGTGIRVSELEYFTVEEVDRGEIRVNSKGKRRIIMIPGKLRKRLLQYAKKQKITSGAIFVNAAGDPVNRTTVWAQMKALAKRANVNPKKVFPRNLRKLFARTFYGIQKDIAKLADVLGHSSIETTRIYIMTTGREHRKQIERMGLVI